MLCSGYPEQAAVKRFDGLGLTGFLEKPYSSESLLRTVRRATDGAGASAGPAIGS